MINIVATFVGSVLVWPSPKQHLRGRVNTGKFIWEVIPDTEKRNVDNEIQKKKLLIKDTGIRLSLFCIEGSDMLGHSVELWFRTVLLGDREAVFTEKPPLIIPLVEGCPSCMLISLYSVAPATERSSNFSLTYT